MRRQQTLARVSARSQVVNRLGQTLVWSAINLYLFIKLLEEAESLTMKGCARRSHGAGKRVAGEVGLVAQVVRARH